MDSNELIIIKIKILKKLYRHGYWGGRHTSLENLHKGFEKRLRGAVKDAAEELIEHGMLRKKPTSYGIEVSLNSEKKAEIEQMIKSMADYYD